MNRHVPRHGKPADLALALLIAAIIAVGFAWFLWTLYTMGDPR